MKKIDPQFRVSFIVQGAEALDTALRAVNGLTVHPPLTEPYQEVPTPITERPKPPKLPKQATRHQGERTLKDRIHEYLSNHNTALSTELSTIAKDNGFCAANVSKAARSAGGDYNSVTKTWSLNK